MEHTGELRDLLSRALRELELSHPDPAHLVESLARLAELLASWAPRVGLTAHREPEAITRHLILDAVALSTVLPDAEAVADLGTGAGFPGLPLALLAPDRPITLVESREKRHHFLRAAVRELSLPNVTLIRGRAEMLPATPHGLVVAQAMGPPEQVLSWMQCWAAPGAWLGIPTSAPPPVIRAPEGVEPVLPRTYRVPQGGPERTLWLARCISH